MRGDDYDVDAIQAADEAAMSSQLLADLEETIASARAGEDSAKALETMQVGPTISHNTIRRAM